MTLHTEAKPHTSMPSPLKFTPIPIFSSNYVWVVEHIELQQAYIVDPGSAAEVIDYVRTSGLSVKGLLITHSHNDHIGGIDQFINSYDVPVFGPSCDRIPQISHALYEGDELMLWPEITASIMHLPGHLPEHIAFLIETPGWPASLLCGDIIFSSGCGRMFSGPASTYLSSLNRIANLAPDTALYCTHEYTQANIRFAKHVEPHNPELTKKSEAIEALLDQTGVSLPTHVSTELLTNPFLRTHSRELLTRLTRLVGHMPKNDVEAFAMLRQLKDEF